MDEPRGPSPVARLLAWLCLRSIRRPWWTVVLAGLAAVGGGLIAAFGLSFKTDRLDLLDPASQYNQRWLAYQDEFGDGDDAVLAVSGPAHQVPVVLDELVELLRAEGVPEPDLLGGLDFDPIKSSTLQLLDSRQLGELENTIRGLPQTMEQWQMVGAASLLAESTRRLQAHGTDDWDADSTTRALTTVHGVAESLRTPPTFLSPWRQLALDQLLGAFPRYVLNAEGTLGLIMVRVPRLAGVPDGQRIEVVRNAQQIARDRHPGVAIGTTGAPILVYDEMQSSRQDMGKSAMLSLLGVTILFAAGFGGLRLPLMAVLTLVIGLGWTMAYITLAIGHLNILSVAFGAILIGLGVDFGIHLVAAYAHCRHDEPDVQRALVLAVMRAGPGILTCGLTSALAFSTAALTRFRGVAELGVIAGGGMVLCMLAALIVLPALIRLAEHGRELAALAPPLPTGVLARGPASLPRLSLAAMLLVSAVLAWQLPRVQYDHNLQNLQPIGTEGVVWERKLVQQSGRSGWHVLSICSDLDELRQRRARLLAMPNVAGAESIEPLLSHTDPDRDAALGRMRQWGRTLPPFLTPVEDPARAERVRQRLLELEQVAGQHAELAAAASEALTLLSRLNPLEGQLRLATYDENVAVDLLRHMQALAIAAAQPPPRQADLPPALVTRFVGRSGKFLLRISARGDARDMEQLEAFVKQVEQVDPRCTGHPVQAYYASRQMQQSYIHAGIYSLLAVAAVLMLDLRSIRLTLLAMLPMAMGLVQLMSLLGWLGIPLNPANMVVLPLMIGIGIDAGVHLLHDYRRRSGGYRPSDSTATAILVTSATTMIGFGSMMVSRHQGLIGLGQALTLGVFCCLVNSLVVLPALLAWSDRHVVSDDIIDVASDVTAS
ncbi:MAG: MMPL family transporter [Planctomycetales bacterium]|nr:MMPL family transporter [Planctomycetales bacterium]